MNKTENDLDNKIIEKYRKLSAEKKRQFANFVDFLIWREQKRSANLNFGKKDDN